MKGPGALEGAAMRGKINDANMPLGNDGRWNIDGDPRMNANDAIGLVATISSIMAVLFVAMFTFDVLAEPWRTIAGAIALAAALLSATMFGTNMLGGKRRESRQEAIWRYVITKLDKADEQHEEMIRLLKIIADAVVKDRHGLTAESKAAI